MAANFKITSLSIHTSLSELLKKSRLEKKLSIKKCAKQLEIQEMYLQAIEDGRYDALPGEVYIKSWVKKYAAYLEIEERDVSILYSKEQSIRKKMNSSEVKSKSSIKFRFWEPRNLKRALGFLLFIIVIIYIITVINSSLRPPIVTLQDLPLEGFRTQENSIIIKGLTEPEVLLELNNRPIKLDTEGNFEQEIILHDGLNQIALKAKKKHSRAYETNINIIKISLPELRETGS